MKAVFQSGDAAARVLRSATTLKDARYSRVYIAPDRTGSIIKGTEDILQSVQQAMKGIAEKELNG